MKVLAMMVFVVVMMVACGGEEPKVDEVVCQMMFDCYENPTGYPNPNNNPFQNETDCQNVVKENVKKGDVDCLMLLDSCDIFDSAKIDSCLEYLH